MRARAQTLAVGPSWMASRVNGGFILRVAISLSLIFLVFNFVDMDQVWTTFKRLEPEWALAAVLLMLVQLFLTAIRWRFVNRALDVPLTASKCIRLMFVGQFFNQWLPTSIGGDGVKIGMLCKIEKLPLQTSVLSVMADRIVGLLMLSLLASLSWFLFAVLWQNPVPQETMITTLLGLGVVCLIAILFVVFPKAEKIFKGRKGLGRILLAADASNKLATRFPVSFQIFGLSALAQGLITLAVYLGARALQIPLPTEALLLIPLIMLVASLPISFAGWGVREGAMITGFAILGISTSEAVSISILYGLIQLLIGLPGSYILAREIGLKYRSPQVID